MENTILNCWLTAENRMIFFGATPPQTPKLDPSKDSLPEISDKNKAPEFNPEAEKIESYKDAKVSFGRRIKGVQQLCQWGEKAMNWRGEAAQAKASIKDMLLKTAANFIKGLFNRLLNGQDPAPLLRRREVLERGLKLGRKVGQTEFQLQQKKDEIAAIDKRLSELLPAGQPNAQFIDPEASAN